MSMTSLPSYLPADSLHRTPTYSYEPQEDERRLALGGRRVARPSGNFIKQSRNGNVSLCLLSQADDAELPVYGSGSSVDGILELSKTEGITSVEVKLEGFLKLREIAEGGSSTARLCIITQTLWTKGRESSTCPSAPRFSLRLPDTFVYEDVTYPLPPTATVNRANASGPALKTKAMGLLAGSSTVTTAIIYHPRTQPPSPLPPRLLADSSGLVTTNEWTCVESLITSRSKGIADIKAKLYIPASRTFSLAEPLPFHLLLSSNAASLAAFLPLSPTANTLGRPKPLRVQVMRQSVVDVRNVVKGGSAARREMWRIDCIGEGKLKLTADAPSWIAYSGEIALSENVKTPGFKAAGLSVKDSVLFTLNPPEPLKSPFNDLRQVVRIRLTTDSCVLGSPVPPLT